jgi:hypothetical protein
VKRVVENKFRTYRMEAMPVPEECVDKLQDLETVSQGSQHRMQL